MSNSDTSSESTKLTIPNSTTTIKLSRQIGLLGGVSIIVGNIIGAGIFISPGSMLKELNTPAITAIIGEITPFISLSIWFFCGFIVLLAALCFAELGLIYQDTDGGDYDWIHKIFGKRLAFIRLWMTSLIMYPTQQAIMVYVGAQYFVKGLILMLCDCKNENEPNEFFAQVLAVSIVVVSYFVNAASVKTASLVNLVATAGKCLALVLLIGLALLRFVGLTKEVHLEGQLMNFTRVPKALPEGSGEFLTLVAVLANTILVCLFSFQGWSYLNFVTSELKKPKKYLPRGILIAVPTVIVLYMSTIASYHTQLTVDEMVNGKDGSMIAFEFIKKYFENQPIYSKFFRILMSFAVFVSASGATHGSILISARVCYAGAKHNQLPNFMGYIHRRNKTPIPALILTVAVTIAMLIVSFMWGIGDLLKYLGFTNYICYTIVVFGLIYIRLYKRKDYETQIEEGLNIPLAVPILFCALSIIIIALFTLKEFKIAAMGIFIMLIIFEK